MARQSSSVRSVRTRAMPAVPGRAARVAPVATIEPVVVRAPAVVAARRSGPRRRATRPARPRRRSSPSVSSLSGAWWWMRSTSHVPARNCLDKRRPVVGRVALVADETTGPAVAQVAHLLGRAQPGQRGTDDHDGGVGGERVGSSGGHRRPGPRVAITGQDGALGPAVLSAHRTWSSTARGSAGGRRSCAARV